MCYLTWQVVLLVGMGTETTDYDVRYLRGHQQNITEVLIHVLTGNGDWPSPNLKTFSPFRWSSFDTSLIRRVAEGFRLATDGLLDCHGPDMLFAGEEPWMTREVNAAALDGWWFSKAAREVIRRSA